MAAQASEQRLIAEIEAERRQLAAARGAAATAREEAARLRGQAEALRTIRLGTLITPVLDVPERHVPQHSVFITGVR